ncbi:amidohydrolase [soil metagenome]
MSDAVHEAAQALAAETVATRRDFHRHPEIAFEETRTAGIIADKLQALNLDVKTGVGKTGVVAVLDTGKPGKTVLVRADIDALPVHEECETEYRSTLDGKMHACGHDGHASVLLSTAKILSERRDELAGKLVFVFQPAEEIVRGAQAMLDDGALDGVKPDHSIGLHLSSAHPAGTVAVRTGPAMAATDSFRILVKGKGGHAARPQDSIDPVVIAANLVTSLQSLVAREVDPVDQAVISMTSIQGGTAYNIIPEAVELKGTLRTFSPHTREYLTERIKTVAKGVVETFRGELDLEWRDGSPAVVNDAAMTERFRAVAHGVVGEGRVLIAPQIMGGDDMALWLERAPGCYFFVGAGDEAKNTHYPHHHPKFDIDETVLPLAVELLTKGALDFLKMEN